METQTKTKLAMLTIAVITATMILSVGLSGEVLAKYHGKKKIDQSAHITQSSTVIANGGNGGTSTFGNSNGGNGGSISGNAGSNTVNHSPFNSGSIN